MVECCIRLNSAIEWNLLNRKLIRGCLVHVFCAAVYFNFITDVCSNKTVRMSDKKLYVININIMSVGILRTNATDLITLFFHPLSTTIIHVHCAALSSYTHAVGIFHVAQSISSIKTDNIFHQVIANYFIHPHHDL